MGKARNKARVARKQEANKVAEAPSARVPVKAVSVPKSSKISDELRQAVKDLGGDEDDFDLIDGLDSDDEANVAPVKPKEKGKGQESAADEKSLRKALGDFMKGLDFPGGSAAAVDDATSEEDVSEADSEEEDDEDEDEESDEDDEDDEEDEEDAESEDSEESEEERPSALSKSTQGLSKNANTPSSSVAVPSDPNITSGTIVPANPSWTSLAPPLPSTSTPLEPVPTFKLAGIRNKATSLLENLPALSRASSSSDAAFISQILQSGTHQDKLSALILIVRESPIHAVKELSRLRSMTGWKEDGTFGGGGNKDQRVAAMKALADWWVTGGGKEAGKLRYFADQPMLNHPEVTDRHLLVWAFEDYLKRWFFNLLQVLEALTHDILPFIKTQALHITFRLLSGNAEQEQNLLRLGVNKLGDNDKAIASKASHHILTLLGVHPAMKAVVAREISALVLKPPTAAAAAASSSHVRFDEEKPSKAPAKSEGTSHARYYGLITLNQITLTMQETETAGKLVELYFEVFREILGDGKDDEEEDDAMKVEKVAGKVEKWRGRRKGAKPKGGRKAAAEEEVVDTDKTRLVAAVLTGINRALPFAKLDEEIFTRHMDILFKITHAGMFNTSIQSLQLIYQVAKTRPAIADRFYRTLWDSLYDSRLYTSSKQAMYLNLVFKSLKTDENIARVMAFVKRLLQMLGMQQPPFICGALYLLGELFNSTPGLKRMLIEPEDDGEEHFVDADREQPVAESSTSQMHGKSYDGRKRDPKFANADTSCLWELTPFLDHFHPSVSLQAQQLLLSQTVTGSSDISLNSLVSFLDRFVYRNPKKNLQPKGASIMQPAAVYDRSGMVTQNKGARTGDDGFVNSEKFWRKKIEDVPVDQMFFHKFFAGKLSQKEAAAKKKKKGGVDSDDEDEEVDEAANDADDVDEADEPASGDESDPEEAEIWKAMQASMPDAGDDMDLSSDEMDSDEGDYSEIESDVEIEDDDEDGELDEDDDLSMDDEEDDDEDEEDSDEADEKPVTKKAKSKGKQKAEPQSDSDSDFPDMADEDEDLLSESEMPDIVLGATPSPSPEPETNAKRKRSDDRKERKRKRREMPVFGTYEDYAAMIDAAGNDGED